MHKVKVTVLKASLNQDLVDLYVEPEEVKTFGPCDVFKEGQEFITDPVGPTPEGFCPWAWDDLRKVLLVYFAGGSFDMWKKDGDTMIACCTDGYRPVYFKLEKLPAE